MKSFLLVVNVLALSLPFLAAETQNQEQQACRENDERPFYQKIVPYIPIYYVPNSYPYYRTNWYQNRPAIAINTPYVSPPYYPNSVRPHAQVPQWQYLPNVNPPTMVHRPKLHPSFIAVPPKKIQDKIIIPTINAITTVEPTPTPATVTTVKRVVTPEASSESIITSTPETTTVSVTTPTV
ncbi:kappa-casein [Aotus nancymaae]|uniref:kappa-casein n=1 Tax=Aotus nancymaae TaxID=37293 RepID=UPI000626CF2F